MKPFAAYSRRYERKRRLLTAALRSVDLKKHNTNTDAIKAGDILLFATLRNEGPRIPYFLEYYRNLGVDHFLIVDNGSDDGSDQLLAEAKDVSLWTTDKSYRKANFGVHWLNGLMHRYANKHWCVVVDPDEFLVYPHCNSRNLKMLTEHLDTVGRVSMGTILLDLYGETPVAETICAAGEDPVSAAPWFDPANYFMRRNDRYRNLWIQAVPTFAPSFRSADACARAEQNTPRKVGTGRDLCFIHSCFAAAPL